ncbi:hypothetical protein GH733_018309, partial [Mirounga leonina]
MVEEALTIKNTDIAKELYIPPPPPLPTPPPILIYNTRRLDSKLPPFHLAMLCEGNINRRKATLTSHAQVDTEVSNKELMSPCCLAETDNLMAKLHHSPIPLKPHWQE